MASRVIPATTLDGFSQFVTLSPDGLIVTKAGDDNYTGARSTALKNTGKYYFEVEIINTRGRDDSCGILREDATYEDMQQNIGPSVVAFHHVDGTFDTSGNFIYGIIASNSLGWEGYGIGEVVNGNIVGVAVNLSDRLIWFRRNGGPWNHYPVPRLPGYGVGNPDADPTINKGGATVGGGRFSPAVFMGVGAGGNPAGTEGSRQSFNFGAKPYAYAPPAGYLDWKNPRRSALQSTAIRLAGRYLAFRPDFDRVYR